MARMQAGERRQVMRAALGVLALALGPAQAMVQPRAAAANLPLQGVALQPLLGARDTQLFLRAAMPEVIREGKKHLVASESASSDSETIVVFREADTLGSDGQPVSSWWSANFELAALRTSEGDIFGGAAGAGEVAGAQRALLSGVELALSVGCRPSQLTIRSESSCLLEAAGALGFVAREDGSLCGDVASMRSCVSSALDVSAPESDGAPSIASLKNVMGRLLHAGGDLGGAQGLYTEALGDLGEGAGEGGPFASQAALLFLNLGSAQAAGGSFTLAHGAWQRCLELDEKFALPYYKLGQMYLQQDGFDGSKKKYDGAGDHAVKCFKYFCEEDDAVNTDALTMLANSYTRLRMPQEASAAYELAIAQDPSLYNLRVNLANALLQMRDTEGAKEQLQSAIDAAPGGAEELPQAAHMLAALGGSASAGPEKCDAGYVASLFDEAYARAYDGEMRRRIYAAPRILRGAVRDGLEREEFAKLPPSVQTMNNNSVLPWLTGSLEVCDLGCGTGLTAAWLRDYAKRLVGVDLSPAMLAQARKREVYDELVQSDAEAFLGEQAEGTFDVLSAAGLLWYVGRVDGLFDKAARALRPGGVFALIADALEGDDYALTDAGTFAHSAAYLEAAAERAGFKVLEESRPFASRTERGEAKPGHLLLLRKAEDA